MTQKPAPGKGAARLILNMQIHQMDPGPLERFKAAVGCGHVYPVRRTGKHGAYVIYRWSANAGTVKRALYLLWPYLCEPKRLQAQAAWTRSLQDSEQRNAAYRARLAA